jgi:hypothetical protein
MLFGKYDHMVDSLWLLIWRPALFFDDDFDSGEAVVPLFVVATADTN